MRQLRETFTDQEFEQIKQFKDTLRFDGKKVSWHDFIIMCFQAYKGNILMSQAVKGK